MPRRVTLEGNESIPQDCHSPKMKIMSHSQTTTPATTTTPIPIQSPPYSPPPTTDWKREYCILRKAYLKQQGRLEMLQEENLHLQRQIQVLLEESTKTTHEHAEKNNTTTTTTTTKKTLPYNSSPGTRFVAELSEVMELDVGQHALLSSIMDQRITYNKSM
jgi:ribulose bisphosphate carboxylase small subunit